MSPRLVVLVALLLAASRVGAAPVPAPPAVPPSAPSARADAAFLGLGLLASGALAVGALNYLGQGGAVGGALLALPVAGLVHYGLGRLIGVPVSATSAAEGVVLGLATGAVGFGLGSLVGSRMQLDSLSLAVVGLVVGAAIGTPLWTLMDPLGFAPSSPPPSPVASLAPVLGPPALVWSLAAGRF